MRAKRNVQDIYPLSPMQAGMLFHTLYAPGSGVYVEQLIQRFQVRGEFNLTAFERAWQQAVERNAILRTAFVWKQREKPLQVVVQRVKLPLAMEDWRDLDPREQARQLEHFLRQDRERGFDLSKAPLMRLILIRMAEDTWQFVVSYHHILLDAWSARLIFNQVRTFYNAFCRGQDIVVEPVRPYRDYIAWLRQQDAALAKAFWRQELEHFAAPTPLVVDQLPSGTSEQSGNYADQEMRLSAPSTAALNSFAASHHLTMSTLIQAAWALWLNRYSGEQDVVFGLVTSGRPASLEGVESMVGLFINTLPLRVRVSPQQPLLPWLKQLQAKQLSMQEYAHTPLVDIQKWSDVPRGTPLFESILDVWDIPGGDPSQQWDQGLTIQDVHYIFRTNYPLTLGIESGQELSVRIMYDCNHFEADTITRMLGHLQTLLEGIVANPEQRLADLPLLTPSEWQQVAQEWNATEAAYPQDQCVPELFEAQAVQQPDAVAVAFEDQHMTYQALNHSANQLAHTLRQLGVSVETLVGVFMERSVEMVVGLLGILKAGAAYVPLDPGYPPERVAFMAADAGAKVLLAQKHMADRLPQLAATVVYVDELAKTSPDSPNPVSAVCAENLAYVIYTSGSTGQPKGAMNTHGGLRNRLQWMQAAYHLDQTDRVLHKTPFSFDVSVWEFFWPLLTGACLVVARPGGHQDSAYLVRAIIEQRVTTLHFVPAMLSVFLQEARVEECASLRRVMCSGEALPLDVQERFFAKLDAELHNLYGPTEAAVDVTYWACQPASGRAVVPIGRPIANIQIYLLDKYMQPVPVGVPGELFIGGVGLGRGYWQRPELTAERFVPNPFASHLYSPRRRGETEEGKQVEDGSRLYKTGDLARYWPGGEIEFLGRTDFQVKLRGFRIELGEIEARLAQHPAVGAAVVAVVEEKLVAYAVPGAAQKPTVNDLRDYLKEKLPDYMLPSAFVMLAALPLTPSGKVDRRALPAPDRSQPEKTFALPRTPTEEVLAGIWALVLGLEQVGIYDNFFNLGGHSLLAIQIASRVRDSLEAELSLPELFESPTVAALAEKIEKATHTRRAAYPAQAKPIERISRDNPLALSFAQERIWFLEQLEPGTPAYNVPMAIHLERQIDWAALEQSLNQLGRRHETLRTTFAAPEGFPIQIIADSLILSLPLADLADLPQAERKAEAQRLAVADANQAFDLARGPLLRARLLRLADTDYILLLNVHHIIFDAWSQAILLRELALLYESFVNSQSLSLPELAIQYADFACWQRQWLQGEALEAQLAYWKQQLAGLAVLELPTDHPRPPVQTSRGAYRSLVFQKPLSKALQDLSRQEDVTLFMTLLAAFKTLLYRYTGQADVCVGSPIAGRVRTEVEGLVGCFLNTLVLRTDLSGNPAFRELLKRVRQVALEAYAHQDLPFEKLVEELQPKRDLSHSPLFQVMFTFQDASLPSVEQVGAILNPIDVNESRAKFDLTLYMSDTGQGLEGTFEYNTDLFDAATIARLAGHFQNILEGIVADPSQRLADLAMLTADERQQVLVEWNATQTDYARRACIHNLVEAQVKRTPDAVAVVCGEQHLTYHELDHRANQLAHHLQALGLRTETLAAICVERSPEMMIGLMGILKAGGAYLPLDAAHPQERLAFMLADTRAPVLLTQAHLMSALPQHTAQVVCLDTDWATIARQPFTTPAVGATSECLAYTIYTSGSTGKPKGVQVEHRAVVNLLNSMRQQPGLAAPDVLLAVTTLAFDIAGLELFLPLAVGARLILLSPAVSADAQQLMATLAAHQVTVMQATPATWRLLLAAGWTGNITRILCGGEAISPDLAAQLLSHSETLWNMYGPTETTIWSSIHRLNIEEPIAIGRPIANTQMYLLDASLQLVPPGVSGELYIGGEGVARGYFQQPGLTAEHFIPNPFASPLYSPRRRGEIEGGTRLPATADAGGGSRLYKTGDVCRYRPDGVLEFLGRADHQVKLRGFRIELGEIEAVLSQHEQVRELVVVARDGAEASGGKQLVAYLVSEGEPALTASELRRFLLLKLPDYMAPSTFVMLDALPLTPSGKIDRRALPEPGSTRPSLETAYIAPRSKAEHAIADIWRQALGVEQVGVEDNFFDLGGHSLLVVWVHKQLVGAFGAHIPMTDMFKYTTISALAQHLSQMPEQADIARKTKERAAARRASVRQRAEGRRNRP